MIDLKIARAETPGCNKLIHFNNAGCALRPHSVIDSVTKHLQLEQQIGGYEAETQAKEEVGNFYAQLAQLLNCKSSEIAFMESATRAWQSALLSLGLKKGDEIITAGNEYAGNYLSLLSIARQIGIEIRTIALEADGLIKAENMERYLGAKTRAILITHIASQRGDIQDIKAIGEIAQTKGVCFLVDACQSVGHVPLDLQEIKCDFLFGTGRKYLRGPRGTGFLFARSESTAKYMPPVIDLQSAHWDAAERFTIKEGAARFESFERNLAGQIGLARAVEYANSLGITNIAARIQSLARTMVTRLEAIQGVRVHELSETRSGIVTFSKVGIEAEKLQNQLHQQDVNTSISKRSNARLDLDRDIQCDVVRVSLHYYNSDSEIERVVQLIEHY
ncbi:MAG: aminotransferase [Gammaproteobacteria bacterium]|nr:aminotransferase [Gammaproteobacteria bacterium]HBW83429.1 aminotransferase [Gammaproteobacteria bacterium]|tara:strand:- start:3316 stop:4485 length:1170 start_codon:yes stop_codon:yes gene_type:complete